MTMQGFSIWFCSRCAEDDNADGSSAFCTGHFAQVQLVYGMARPDCSKEPEGKSGMRLQKNVGFSSSQLKDRHVSFHRTCSLRISGSWTTNEMNHVKQPGWWMVL